MYTCVRAIHGIVAVASCFVPSILQIELLNTTQWTSGVLSLDARSLPVASGSETGI